MTAFLPCQYDAAGNGRHGKASQGEVWFGLVGCGAARQVGHGLVRQG